MGASQSYSQKKQDEINLDLKRRLFLGPLYDTCKQHGVADKHNIQGVSEEDLKVQLERLKLKNCGKDCTLEEMIQTCQLKIFTPS